MQYLETLPGEILEIILRNLKDSKDLINCSRAHPRLDQELRKWKCFYLLPHILPFVITRIGLPDVLKILDVCSEWRDGVPLFDNHVPGRLPYDDELYLERMKTVFKDPSEHGCKNDVWFLTFKSIGKDLRRFRTEMAKHLEKIPSGIGRSAYFEINNDEWSIQQIYLHKLDTLLQTYGKHFWYVKLKLTYALRINHLQDVAFIRLLLRNLPNARYIDIDVDIDDGGRYVSEVEQVSIPNLPLLESLCLNMGRSSSELREKHIVEKHADQLKKLRMTAWAGNLPRQMPHLVELYLHGILTTEIFDDLKLLQAPLQKLTLHILSSFRQFDMADMLEKIAHLPLRHLTVQWDYIVSKMVDCGTFVNINPKFRTIQFPAVHTLNIYNSPEDWHPLLVSFPSLTYLNIRLTLAGTVVKDAQQVLRQRDDLIIKKILYGHEAKCTKYPADLNPENFPELRLVSTEMYGYGGTARLLRSRKWTRSCKRDATENSELVSKISKIQKQISIYFNSIFNK